MVGRDGGSCSRTSECVFILTLNILLGIISEMRITFSNLINYS